MDSRTIIENTVTAMLPLLDEKQGRLFLALEANSIGRGGVKLIHEISGMSQTTIIRGKKELESGRKTIGTNIRKSGGGRKGITQTYEGISAVIAGMIGDEPYGNPERVLPWTTKSVRNLEAVLHEKGYKVSHDPVGNILREMGYSLQQNRNMLQTGEANPDRDAPCNDINKKSGECIGPGQPVISVDTKKKERIGNFKNNGAEYGKKKSPTKVLDHDVPIQELGKVWRRTEYMT